MCGGRWMQVVRLEQSGRQCDTIKQEVHECSFADLGDFAKNLVELSGVGPVVGREALSHEEYTGSLLLRRFSHGQQVFAHRGNRKAAQPIVRTESNDDDAGRVFFQRFFQPGSATAGGFSRDAGVDDAIIQFSLLQPFGQQAWPGGVLRDTVSGRQ